MCLHNEKPSLSGDVHLWTHRPATWSTQPLHTTTSASEVTTIWRYTNVYIIIIIIIIPPVQTVDLIYTAITYHHITRLQSTFLLTYTLTTNNTSGNSRQLHKSHVLTVSDGHSFAKRIVNVWNSLPDYIVLSYLLICLIHYLPSYLLSPSLQIPMDSIRAMMIVWRSGVKIIRTVLCCIVYNSCAQWYAHTRVKSS